MRDKIVRNDFEQPFYGWPVRVEGRDSPEYYAAEQGIDEIEIALDEGMKAKSEEFKKAGSEIYSKA